jgi:glutathione synthase/RimK-type ligase-like ATP-grasp enzyme
MGLRPAWVVPNGLFVITVNGREQYINLARSHFNSAVSVSLAKDKYLTRMILQRSGMNNIPFARPRTLDDAYAFLATHGTIVAKPVAGSGSQDIHIITSPEQLDSLAITGYILEKYITGKEMRYLVLNDAVIGVYHSDYGTSVATNRPLECIAYPEDGWDDEVVADALRVNEVLGLRFAAIDFLIADNQHYILEVNTMPDLKWFHNPSSGPRVDVAGQLLEAFCGLVPGAGAGNRAAGSLLQTKYS